MHAQFTKVEHCESHLINLEANSKGPLDRVEGSYKQCCHFSFCICINLTTYYLLLLFLF